MVADATFTDQQFACGHHGCQSLACAEVHFEGMQVAIINAEQWGRQFERTLHFMFVMHFHGTSIPSVMAALSSSAARSSLNEAMISNMQSAPQARASYT